MPTTRGLRAAGALLALLCSLAQAAPPPAEVYFQEPDIA